MCVFQHTFHLLSCLLMFHYFLEFWKTFSGSSFWLQKIIHVQYPNNSANQRKTTLGKFWEANHTDYKH